MTTKVPKPPANERGATELRAAADELEVGNVEAAIEHIGGVLGDMHEIRAEERLRVLAEESR